MLYIFPFLGLYLQVSAESANEFGELVADPVTKELLHYTEKPETFVCTECSYCPDVIHLIGALMTLTVHLQLCVPGPNL